MRRAERVHAPALGVAAGDERADARDLVKRVFREIRPERLANIGLRGVAEVEHPRRRREVGDGL
jgi:hypothetical protein